MKKSQSRVSSRCRATLKRYHFRVLNNAGLIELAATERKRGSIQSFYQPVRSGWGDFLPSLREMLGDEREDPTTA